MVIATSTINRAMISKLSLIVIAAILLASATQAMAAPKTIGVIMTGDIPYYKSIHKTFMNRMKGQGDFKFVVQSPAPEPMSWTNAARKLVIIGSDMIVAYGAPATLTTMKETSSIPIAFAGVYDPDSMRMSGKNATGISSKIPMDKILSDLMEIKKYQKLAVVFNKAEKDTILQVKEIKALEKKLGFKIVLFNSGQKGFASKIKGVDAILMTTSCAGMCGLNDIIGISKNSKIPIAATLSGNKGVTYIIAADPTEQGNALADTAKKIMSGASPASIPFKSAQKFQIVVNLKEAIAIGLTVPQSIISSATEVIK